MSYQEIAMNAIYDRNKKFPDDYPTGKPLAEEEKQELDTIFGFPKTGAITGVKKVSSVKGGNSARNHAL